MFAYKNKVIGNIFYEKDARKKAVKSKGYAWAETIEGLGDNAKAIETLNTQAVVCRKALYLPILIMAKMSTIPQTIPPHHRQTKTPCIAVDVKNKDAIL